MNKTEGFIVVVIAIVAVVFYWVSERHEVLLAEAAYRHKEAINSITVKRLEAQAELAKQRNLQLVCTAEFITGAGEVYESTQ